MIGQTQRIMQTKTLVHKHNNQVNLQIYALTLHLAELVY